MYSLQDRQQMADICNGVFKKTDFKHLIHRVKAADFSDNDNNQLIWWAAKNGTPNGANKLIPVFSKLVASKRNDIGQFYHFKPSISRVREIIREKKIQSSALYYQSENDHAEFEEFLKRTGFLSMFCNNKIDNYKQRIFILCFTKNFREQKFWKEYSSDDRGACIVFRFEFKTVPNAYLFDLRDVTYDTGYKFDFINDLRYNFLKHFNKELFLDGIIKFAQFYKRGKYTWENETRLSFDYTLYAKELNLLFPITPTINANGQIIREYISVDFDNSLFKLSIDEIICGRKVTIQEMNDIKTDINDPSIKVWKRP